ncbi:MFS transporter [Candidatus Uhrbacteria bacterium]|nr:MFS transporter [Candidatus Uhrbacteria bacterium]
MRSASRTLFRFLPLWVFVFIFKIGAGMHYALFTPLAERVLPLPIVGVLVAGAALGQLLLDVPAGLLLDRYGYVRLLRYTTICFLLAGIVFGFGLSPWVLVVSLVISIGGWLFFDPGIAAYLLTHTPAGIAGRVMSFRDVVEAGGLLCSVVALAWLLALPLPILGALLALLFSIALVALGFLPKETRPVPAGSALSTRHYFIRRRFVVAHLRSVLRRFNPASTMLLVSGFSSTVFYGILWFVVPLMVARGTQSGIPSAGLAVFDIAVIVSGFFLGRLADRWNRGLLVLVGLFIFAVAGTMLGFSLGVWFLLLGFLTTAGEEMASVALWAWLHQLDRDHTEDAFVAGTVIMIRDMGWMVGPLLAGFLFGAVGPEWTIAVGACFVFVAWGVAVGKLGTHHFRALLRQPLAAIPTYPHRRRHKG